MRLKYFWVEVGARKKPIQWYESAFKYVLKQVVKPII
jgi:hypothetical protein